MRRFRLKPEAVPFFKESLKTLITSYDRWTDTYNVDPNALEEVKPCYIEYGHAHVIKGDDGRDIKTGSLSGWDEKGTHFHFTIHFPSAKYCEHDKFTKGNILRKLMDAIQHDADNWYENFSNEEGGAQ